MKPEDVLALRTLPRAEVLDQLEKKKFAIAAAKLTLAAAQQGRVELMAAKACQEMEAWPGDEVQVVGYFHGKTDPVAQLVGFAMSWGDKVSPLVKLLKKNGKYSEHAVEAYSNKVRALPTNGN